MGTAAVAYLIYMDKGVISGTTPNLQKEHLTKLKTPFVLSAMVLAVRWIQKVGGINGSHIGNPADVRMATVIDPHFCLKSGQQAG
jgi:hypothetical protein